MPMSMSRIRSTAAKRRQQILTLLLVLFAGAVIALIVRNTKPPKGFTKGWRACDLNKDLECGFISLPRDYFNASAGKTDIAVARLRATDERRRVGTLFINPGGPGGSGVSFANAIAKPLSQLVQGRYDILGFDPRGVGKTEHAVACFVSTADRQIFQANSPLSQSFNIPPDPTSPEGRAVIASEMKEWMSGTKAQFELCQNAMGSEDLVYMSTSTVARDIDYMATALDGEDATINYFGVSYGTVLGSYLINMFPKRVGRVAIDGVVHPELWATTPSHTWLNQWMNATELAFEYLLTMCGSAGPELCPLARTKGETAADIAVKIDNFLDDLYKESISVLAPNAPRTALITSGMARALLYSATMLPKWWPRIAAAVADASKGNYGDLAQLMIGALDTSAATPVPGDNARPYNPDRPDTWPRLEDYTDAAVARLKDVSPRFAMSPMIFDPDGGCQYLSRVAQKVPGRFVGPFNSTLRNRVLVVNGDMDPLTPLVSARWVNDQLGDSARLVIQQQTPAHTSFFFGPSLCTARAYRRYFVSGLLPEAKETFCGSDETIFETPSAATGGPSIPLPDAELRGVVASLSKAVYDWISIGLPG
ncbi:hypothetical protein EXIGLDRAFT_847400 [Exidia glandulosa HHB12029]|uniref:Alpha/beta-hydrolase n=1 Tax=Exidia glandulosa HHB12029 TaxID=1314781 RepID=A0A166MYZ8_EXIGL|nr:hypothetical protein EXIGLDRAFT_847400 [Exidia glandulosa HHB12029]